MDRRPALILSLLITILVASNFYFFSYYSNQSKESILIIRVIDGDTIEVENGEKIRLENINTPEKNFHGYEEAKSFLSKYTNSSLQIERTGTDKYGRTLAKIYSENLYLNLEIVNKGLGTKFLVNEDELSIFSEAEQKAIDDELGIFKHSEYIDCITIDINHPEDSIIISNSCNPINFHDFTISDESRKNYKFQNIQLTKINLHSGIGNDNSTDLFWNNNGKIWNTKRNSIYIFDEKNLLVHYQTFGY